MRNDSLYEGREQEQGFTLIEALVAMVILMFGIAAVANLMVVAGTSNTVANHSTAAAAVAAAQMELIKSVPFNMLPGAGGSLTANVGATGVCGTTPVTATFNCNRQVPGVGFFRVRWQISAPLTGQGFPDTRFIQVRAESLAPAIGLRSRADFTAFRTL